ncbi:response regulator [Clavibacter zhangzhiyongii]|jgi:DNA-binding NarL/FixJ family response regulator|uniref:response regulator n=1 Tax=Clavibacter zhangzhiyongii TaxID=2768071 RepID=UPI0039E07CE1
MIRVLIVDDDPLVRAGLRFICESADDIVVVGDAADGQAGAGLAATARPDVILMDVRMPVMDGREATATIVAADPEARVLALTTFDQDTEVLSVLDAGARGYLLKDTPPMRILDALRETAAGRTVLSPHHARVLLDGYADNGAQAERRRARELVAGLTDRERQVVGLVAEGLTNVEIGQRMHCAPATAKAHVASVFAKLGITNRVRLAVLGHQAGLLDGHA